MKREKFFGIIPLLSVLITSSAYAQDQREYITHDFDDGRIFPYEVPKADQEARVKVLDGSVETHWDQELYNGTNSGRKAQIRQAGQIHSNDEVKFTQHIWMGFRLKVHNDYMRNNTNTNAGLMQVWGHNGESGAENHMFMIKFDGRNGGALVWQHRYNSVANKTHYLIYPDFPRDRFVNVVVHVKLAERDKGLVQVWVDDELMLNRSGQTIGWGQQDAGGMINGTYAFGTSIGQYNYFVNAAFDDAYDGDDHFFDGHLAGETRTVSYDNVSLYNGADGYALVDPDEGDIESPVVIPAVSSGTVVHMVKRNATGFAIDGGRGGVSGQSVYLWEENDNNANQQWVEIDRGNGFYSYEKRGTNYCIDGNNGGANGQDAFLWTCAASNQNQHWKKVSAADGTYRLEKRNSPRYSLDGNRGGASAQNVYLWGSNDNNPNQQWYITPIGSD